MDDVPDNNDNY